MLKPNEQQNFFRALIGGLMVDINQYLLNGCIPHMILHTGDDTLWVLDRGYNASIEPCEISNKDYPYMVTPRGMLELKGITMLPDQFTSPYVRGNFDMEDQGDLKTYNARFRRIPFTMGISITYVLDNFNTTMMLIQQLLGEMGLNGVRTYEFSYLGQVCKASYKLPDSLADGSYQVELDNSSNEDRHRKIQVEFDLESYLPIFDMNSISDPNVVILRTKGNIEL